MLKRILFLLSLLFCLSFSTASAENWKLLKSGTYDNKTVNSYIDMDRIEKTEDTGTVWTRVEVTGVRNLISNIKFYRKPRTYDFLYFIDDKLDGKGPEKKEATGKNAKNNPIYPESFDEMVYKSIWPTPSENWVHISTSEDGKSMIYLDTNSIDKKGNVATAWLKYLSATGYGLVKAEFRKDPPTVIYLQYSTHYPNGKVYKMGPAKGKHSPLKQGSVEEAAYNMIWPNEK